MMDSLNSEAGQNVDSKKLKKLDRYASSSFNQEEK